MAMGGVDLGFDFGGLGQASRASELVDRPDAAPAKAPDADVADSLPSPGLRADTFERKKAGMASSLLALDDMAATRLESAQTLADAGDALPKPWQAPDRPGMLVPLYTYPMADGKLSPPWQALVDAKSSRRDAPVIAVVNPDSGLNKTADAAGTRYTANPDYVAGIRALKDAGVTVVGYVATGAERQAAAGAGREFGGRDPGDVRREIDAWRDLYRDDRDVKRDDRDGKGRPMVSGIFFDEMATDPTKAAYYGDLAGYARRAGFDLTVGNPGAEPPANFIGRTTDILLVREGAAAPYDDGTSKKPDGTPALQPSALDPAAIMPHLGAQDPAHFAVVAHTAGTFDPVAVKAATGKAGWVFVTPDVYQGSAGHYDPTKPRQNPWDFKDEAGRYVPTYFGRILDAIDPKAGH